ncbi:MAG TPA: VCBS repeat-containing protein [Pseudomonadota bacterium]|nr:VCBS repeat-containing protein [Pseudomonadota bacterium]HNN52539.1 VCBS repeat-containing protein [Pseudomonadota bacterium]
MSLFPRRRRLFMRAAGSGLAFGLLLASACSPARLGVDEEDGLRDGGDSTSTDMSTGPGKPCGADSPCPMGWLCHMGQCVPDRGTCCSDNDCQNDTRCSVQVGDGGSCGVCLDWKDGESDAMCKGNGFSATEFKAPIDHCQWPAKGAPAPVASDVVMTPLVIDLDGDAKPEIVFAPQVSAGPSRLVAMSGKDCTVRYDVDANIQGFSQIAAADLDGDKRPEIIALLATGAPGSGHSIGVFEGTTGKLITSSTDAFALSGGVSFDCSGPAVADLDGDGAPEIVVGGMALRFNKAKKQLEKMFNSPVVGATWGTLTLVNDMDGDGKPDIISGNRIFDGQTGVDKTPSSMASLAQGGYPAIGDFNKDGSPDIVFVQSASNDQKVAVIDVKADKFLMPMTSIPGGWGGPPTVADFDGDGTPDFGTAGPRSYYVFSLDCLKTPKPAKCRGTLPGVLWNTVTKDVSSGGTASSVFDFNGDGRAEVVYRDECWLRVYNGPDGKTVFARPITSGTALEMPIVADVDNDGHADLIVPSDSIQGNGYCADQNPERDTGMAHTGVTQGVFVLKDPMNRWMPSRPLWNQHTYHITNVNDDGTIPAKETPNWSTYNNYRQNIQGTLVKTVPLPDATSKGSPSPDQVDCSKQWKLYAQVCNRGSDLIATMIPGTFYKKDPRIDPASAICVAYTTAPIPPGKCEVVSCAWDKPVQGSVDLWFRANDDGKGARPQPQCKNGNDLSFMPGAHCTQGPG